MAVREHNIPIYMAAEVLNSRQDGLGASSCWGIMLENYVT